MSLDSLKDEIAAAAKGAKHSELKEEPGRTRLITLPLEVIELDPSQPRRDLGDLDEMAASIKQHGVLQPIIVSPTEEGSYRLVMGERRYTASQKLGLKSIPCLVRTVEEHKRLELQVIENIHRKAFTAVEEARAYQRLIDEHRYRHEDLANSLGKSRTSVTQTLTILKLPEEMLNRAEREASLTSSLLLEIAKEEGEVQEKMFEAALSGQATVRSLRAVKAAAKRGEPETSTVVLPMRSARVLIKFDDQAPTWARVIEALRQAEAFCEQELKRDMEDAKTPKSMAAKVAVPLDYLRKP